MIPQNKPVHGFHRLSHLSTLGNHLGRQKSHLSAEPWPLNPAFLLPLLPTRTLRHPGPCLYRYIPLLGFALHDDCVLLRVLVFLQTSFSDCHHHRPVSGSFFSLSLATFLEFDCATCLKCVSFILPFTPRGAGKELMYGKTKKVLYRHLSHQTIIEPSFTADLTAGRVDSARCVCLLC